MCSLSANCGFITLSISWKIQSLKCQQMIFPLILGERPTLFSDIWSLSAVLLQWLLESPPWDFQDLCARYQYRENKHVSISSKWAKRNEAKHERKYWFRHMIANKSIYRSCQYYESKILHKTEVSWFSKVNNSLKPIILIKSLTKCRSVVQYASFDTFKAEIGRFLTPKLVFKVAWEIDFRID